jgi:hypothetical protein
MDHEHVSFVAFDGHDLQRLTVHVLAEIDEAARPRRWATRRWGLLDRTL